MDRSFQIAIIGRPNVGKSRLFNRLVGEDASIVHDTEGVTRDRLFGQLEWDGVSLTVVDTGGFVPGNQHDFVERVRKQVQLAIEQADAVLFVVDGREGILPVDREVAERLREVDTPVFLTVNKVDQSDLEQQLVAPFYELGLEPFPVSAEHGLGVESLLEEVVAALPTPDAEASTPEVDLTLAIVGKPNSGKSTLVNQLVREKRILTSPEPGTTRDSIDTFVEFGDQRVKLVDTAGLRKKNRISDEIEQYAVVQAINSIERADVAVLMIDATEGVTNQVKKIVGVVKNRSKGLILAVNKWDRLEKGPQTGQRYENYIRAEMPFADSYPIVFLSALTGQHVGRIVETAFEIKSQLKRRIQTSELNDFLEDAVERHQPPVYEGKRVKFFYGTQVAVEPPTFIFFCNYADGLKDSYRRYLKNQLRETYGFEGAPLEVYFRQRD